jgi:hypothetical protein
MNSKKRLSKGFVPKLVVPKSCLSKSTAKVGEAVYNILSKEQKDQSVEETISAMTEKYFDELMKAAESGKDRFQSPYYVVVTRKKETLAGNVSNVLFHKYTTRQTKPKAKFLREEFPNADHDLYEIDAKNGSITLVFTLPTEQDSNTVLKNKHLYDPQLVKWIQDYNAGYLDLD